MFSSKFRPAEVFSNKLRPAENFFFGFWPSGQFEFKAPDLDYRQYFLLYSKWKDQKYPPGQRRLYYNVVRKKPCETEKIPTILHETETKFDRNYAKWRNRKTR